jgi:MFS transporter, PAT family, beta-lactamase induction signal transducer AmpG
MNSHMDIRAGSTPAKLGLLGSLYFSQGLPFGFFTQALPVLLRKAGFSLGEIGLASLLAMPWALKFLWAPLVDRHSISRIGRRKSWIVPLQFGAVAILAGLALSSDDPSMTVLMGAVLLLNLVAATQDIATDGLAVDMLEPKERGVANGLQVAGYRVGMIVGGGVLLIFYDRLGAANTFLAMSALTALATLPIIMAREPRWAPEEAERSNRTKHFLRRPGAARLLLLVVAYKAGDAFATGMLRPFLADAGLTLADIGLLLGTVGFVAGLLGALAGGALVNRLGRRQALTAFALLQAVTIAGYAYLAFGTPTPGALYVVCAAEHFAGGMATAALFTCMMDWCSREASATDYTVQASAVVIATGTASALAGFSAQALGYFGHFCLAAGLALGALYAVWRLFPTTEAVRRFHGQPAEVMSCA